MSNLVEQSVGLGSLRRDWPKEPPRGDCKGCGGQCDGDECGLHAAGCVYGGPSEATAYWTVVEGCPLYHGE